MSLMRTDFTAGGEFQWADALSSDFAPMDDDHREMFVLMNMVFSAARLGADTVTQAVADLCLFTKEHFGREEAAMERAGYPSRDAHRYDHEYLIFRLEGLIDRLLAEGPERAGDDLVELLRRWLTEHILTFDTAFACFLGETGRGA